MEQIKATEKINNPKSKNSFFMRRLNKECPMIPDEERKIKVLKDGTRVDRIRELPNKGKDEVQKNPKYWFIFDFDDVIFKATTMNNYIRKQLSDKIGLSPDLYDKIYESYVNTSDGRRIFERKDMICAIKKKYSGKEKIIDDIFNNLYYNDFIDEGMRRAIETLHFSNNHDDTSRITILTHGKFDFQKNKIDKTSIGAIAHDVGYTDGSKKNSIEILADEFYPDNKNTSSEQLPILITIDDNPLNIDEYEKLNLPMPIINSRHLNRQAKRYKQTSNAKDVLQLIETSLHRGALLTYELKKILDDIPAGEPDINDIKKRIDVFNKVEDSGKPKHNKFENYILNEEAA